MNKILLVAGVCLLIISAIGFVYYEKPEVETQEDEINYYERVELYYNIDDNTKAYIKSEDGSFEEVMLNGNS